MGNYYSYMRISTKENNDKQSFNRQEKSLKTYAKDNNIEVEGLTKKEELVDAILKETELN